jgi:ABC-type uncharacterized transport system auxiliary subunit
MRCARAIATVIFALASGCALTEKSKPLDVTFYTPECIRTGVESHQAAPGPALRLGRVASGTDLGERIVTRDGSYKVVYYDGRRWTERPQLYVQRALTRTLFEESGFHRALVGDVPTLDVEVLNFEEVTTPVQHAARITLRLILSTDRVLFEDTVAVSEPVTGAHFDDFVAAMARALGTVSDEVVRRVDSAFRHPPGAE